MTCFTSPVWSSVTGVSDNAQEAKGISEGVKYVFSTSIYTKHWDPKPEHNNDQKLIGIERYEGNEMWGVAFFKNSFNQDSQFVYWGKEFRLDDYVSGMRTKWAFGLLHGYRGKYKNKIPFNNLHVAPAILPTIGFSTRYLETDLVFLGANAITLSVSAPVRF
ncbi:sn-glycerol-3-phosphate transporter [uncultured Endozoicomonas sp.]|uniref:sn-glycerol-3-phosphate transporter n=1 Tax=uncultured Endozoicomonas sp. TaxID=432652 RepID=UPI002635B387|nr:sn-glycerol-3-phosphate transporter [uncultured Endozoicomonas sp.]